MDRGDHVRDVAHVGRRERPALDRRRPAERGGVGRVQRDEGGVVPEVEVVGLRAGQRHLAAGRHGRAAEAVLHPGAQPGEVGRVGRPDLVRRGRPGRDDVRRLARAGDHPVHVPVAGKLLAEQADRDLGERHRVRRVARLVRGQGRVGRPAPVGHVQRAQRERAEPGRLERPGMDHHRGVHAVEHARLQQQRLAAAALLRRGADHLHGQAEVPRVRGQCQRGPHGRGRDDVVPARVPEAGQRVVLGAERHRGPAVAGRRGERGGQPARAGLHSETGRGQRPGQPRRGPVLPERGLRMGVQPVAEPDQQSGVLPHGPVDRLLDVRHRSHSPARAHSPSARPPIQQAGSCPPLYSA